MFARKNVNNNQTSDLKDLHVSPTQTSIWATSTFIYIYIYTDTGMYSLSHSSTIFIIGVCFKQCVRTYYNAIVFGLENQKLTQPHLLIDMLFSTNVNWYLIYKFANFQENINLPVFICRDWIVSILGKSWKLNLFSSDHLPQRENELSGSSN